MIYVNDRRLDFFSGVRGHGNRHGIGQIHREKGDIDFAEAAHGPNEFGVPCDIDSFFSKRKDIAVSNALWMVRVRNIDWACINTGEISPIIAVA